MGHFRPNKPTDVHLSFISAGQVNKPKKQVIEIPSVKWKEGGFLVGSRTISRNTSRVINCPLGIRERLLPTRVLMSKDQLEPMSTLFISACQELSELTLKINTEEDGDSSFGL